MNEATSFGQRAAKLKAAQDLVALEVQSGRKDRFGELDDLLGELLVRSLTAHRIVSVRRGRHQDDLSIEGLDAAAREVLTDRFLLANQRTRGAWFVPEKVSLKAGVMNLPATFAAHPRFASGLVWEERARILLDNNPDGVLAWSVLEQLFEELFLPFELRGRLTGTKERDEQLAAWAAVGELVVSLGLDLRDELAVMRYGGGWSRLRAPEQLEAKQRLLSALSNGSSPQLAARYRAHRVLRLIGRYYSKAKEGRARHQQVLTRPLEKTLAGFFGGDWLSFLDYLGEEPHPDEEITKAIPEIKLLVGGTKSAAAVAAEKGLPAEEVERMLATFWETSAQRGAGVTSPIQERVGVLEAFWRPFDELHARQAPGMRSLWGFVEEVRAIRIGWEGPQWHNARLYEEVLPAELNRDIERLWGTIMLPRWSDRIVSEISPHALMAQAFGPALRFWNECALTAWFVCEGPMSRTDMAGLPAYHQDAIADLQRLGCPLDASLFGELREAEGRLGKPQPIGEDRSSVEVAAGISIEVITSTGTRRPGFKRLRDIITRHRRAWADRYLLTYLRARWETELREAARLHAQAIAERGKPPTAKQFAKHAATPVNHWFGGDLAAFYAAIGEKAPVHPQRGALMPHDRRAFALAVFERLAGHPFEPPATFANGEEGEVQPEKGERDTKLGWLAADSIRFLQLEEALGRTPTTKEFGAPTFDYQSTVLTSNTGEAWDRYVAVIESLLREAGQQPSDDRETFPTVALESPPKRSDQLIPPLPPRPDVEPPQEGHAQSWVRRLRHR